MSTLERRDERVVARLPSVLASLIKKDLEYGRKAADEAAEPYYRAAGEKMLETKDQMKHGQFGPWIKVNFNITIQHARRYMAFAEATSGEKERARSFSTFSDFMRKEGGDPGYGKVVRK
jgi:hypothetical protein